MSKLGVMHKINYCTTGQMMMPYQRRQDSYSHGLCLQLCFLHYQLDYFREHLQTMDKTISKVSERDTTGQVDRQTTGQTAVQQGK